MNNQITITVSGRVGSGKSAMCGEIEILCKALGLEVQWQDGQQEKNLTHADWTEALEMYKPKVTIVERALLAAGASEGQEPVAWRWRLTAEINGKQWGPGPWEYTTHPEKFESRTLYEVEPLYLHPSAEIAALRERIAGMEKDAERLKELCKTLANIMQDQTVAMQSALIEWEFGKGAEAGLGWIVNTLEGPGNLPDPDAEHGKNAQFWFSANCAEPMPKCFCGNPSNTLWMGQGFCCREHYNEAKAKYDAVIAKEKQG